MTDPTKPLAGLRVLELGALVAAPYCGMLLADMGAEVIKIEPPEGDMARQFAPFINGESAFFLSVNRSKRSVCLDLKDQRALEWVRVMASKADIVIHNFRTGVAERLGLSYSDLKEQNPGLVYCAVSGFGPEGPLATRPAIDLIFQAESGMLAITGEPDGPPVKVGTNAADVYAATTAAMCISAALVQRANTGLGTEVHVALRDAFLALQACWFTSFLATGTQPARMGSGSPFTAPTDVYQTQDGHIVLAVVNEKHWSIFCQVLHLEHLHSDPKFGSNESRVAQAGILRNEVNAVLATKTTSEWLAEFDRAGIPAGQVMTYADVVADEQIQFNEMIIESEHPVAGNFKMQGIPFWFAGEKNRNHLPPPVRGADTEEVLLEMGCPPDVIAELVVP